MRSIGYSIIFMFKIINYMIPTVNFKRNGIGKNELPSRLW